MSDNDGVGDAVPSRLHGHRHSAVKRVGKLSQMITLDDNDLMSVSGRADADPLDELQAMGGTPTETSPRRTLPSMQVQH